MLATDGEPYGKRRSNCKAYSTVVGGFLYMIVLGSVYCTGVFSSYIHSYYELDVDNHLQDDLLPACLLLNILTMPIGSWMVQSGWAPHNLLIIGGVVTFPLFILSSFMGKFWAFALFYVTGFTWNQGICYMVAVHHGWLWFPNNAGLVSGIILAGFGVGGLIFDNVFTHVINPDNLPKDSATGLYDQSVNDRFIKTWRLLVACWFVLQLAGVFLVFKGPETEKK